MCKEANRERRARETSVADREHGIGLPPVARPHRMERSAGVSNNRRLSGPHRPLRVALWLALPAATAAVDIGAALAADPLAPGDVLRVAVAEAPELGRDEVKIGADGRIMLPKIGGVTVGGADVDAARERIESALVEKGLLRAPTILVEVAAHRPFFVGGAVAEPGAVPFEVGLTVRHALILAGGLARGEGPDRLDVADIVELKGRWRARTYALLQVEAAIARLESELAAADRPDFRAVREDRVADEEAAPVFEAHRNLFRERAAERTAQENHLAEAIALNALEIDVLTEQGALEVAAQRIQRDQLENSRQLFEKNLLPLPRLQALEFDLSRISREVLANRAYIARARQSKATNEYELNVTGIRRYIEMREKLLGLMVERAGLEAETETVAAALVTAGIDLSDDDRLTAPEPEVTIHRARDGATETIEAAMDTPILPGDVLEVRIASRRPNA